MTSQDIRQIELSPTMGPSSKRTMHNCSICIVIFLLSATTYGVTNFTCPEFCSCDLTLSAITCVNASLQDFPENLPANTSYLNLSSNAICETNSTLEYLVQLQVLDISYNCLRTVVRYGIHQFPNLEELYMQQNQVTSSELSYLISMASLVVLNLAHNRLTSLADDVLYPPSNATQLLIKNTSQLNDINLSSNQIDHLPLEFLLEFPVLHTFNISNNHLETIASSPHALPIHVLDLSSNHLTELPLDAFQGMDNLLELSLAHNPLCVWEPQWSEDLSNLNHLVLSDTAIANISEGSFAHFHSLRYLELNDMQRLWFLDSGAFDGLDRLTHLQLRGNTDLHSVPLQLFWPLHHLVEVDFSNNNLHSISDDMWNNLTALQSVALHGNPFLCDCHITWLKTKLLDSAPPEIVNQDKIICHKPRALFNTPLLNSSLLNMTCAGANIIDFEPNVYFPIGDSVVLDCLAEGSPQPQLTWITPRNVHLQYDPAFGAKGKPQPHWEDFHQGHHWHGKRKYFVELPPNDRIHILMNGSLYIDYIQRIDGGPYRCIAHNQLGNDSIVIDFKLNYDIIYHTKVWSIFFGFCCALVFLFLSIIFATVRHFATTCTPEHQQKRKTLREVIGSLDAYKTAQFEKMHAYKSAKFDQLSAFKTDRVHKLKMRMLTMQTIVDYMKGMRQHYQGSVTRIKDNCTQQADRLRDQYSSRMDQFKYYRSHQIEKIRDNYSQQVMKVREYGTQQVEKLREQYKLQQQHILKLLEILDIGNCMTVIEAECMRTESMLFDPDFYLGLDTHPVHILPHHLHSDSENADSEYETASQSSKVNLPDDDITLDLSAMDTPGMFTVGTADLPGVHLFLPQENTLTNRHRVPHRRPRKHRSRSHTRNEPAADEEDEDLLTGVGQKSEKPHRKRRNRKHRNASHSKEREEGCSNETSQSSTNKKSTVQQSPTRARDSVEGDQKKTQERRHKKHGKRRRRVKERQPQPESEKVVEHSLSGKTESDGPVTLEPAGISPDSPEGAPMTPSEYETPQQSQDNSPETEQLPSCPSPMAVQEETAAADHHIVIINPDEPEKYASLESTV